MNSTKKRQGNPPIPFESWLVIVAKAFPTLDVGVPLAELYDRIAGHPRTKSNLYWKGKVKWVLQSYRCFDNVSEAVWSFRSDDAKRLFGPKQ